ncbi:MAG: LysR family transcriptional regulator [Desulfosporosinus sp.]|nr:LysR family transcriptional regulator [Desulfosporosinus sp.]
MTLNQFSYFLAVAKWGSFSKAADELFISQSSLSKQIRSLESELNISLFNRKSYPISLTPAGKHFLNIATKFIDLYKDMLFQMSMFSSMQKDNLRIGSIPVLSHYGLIPQIVRFKTEYPGIHLVLREGYQHEIWEMFQQNLLDFAIIRIDLINCNNLDIIPLLTDEIVLVCSGTHSLAKYEVISIKELRTEPFVILDERSEIHHLTKTFCRNNGFDPIVVYTSMRNDTLLSMINEGLGISLIPINLVKLSLFPQLVCIPLKEQLSSTTALVKSKNTDQENSSQIQDFYNFFNR